MLEHYVIFKPFSGKESGLDTACAELAAGFADGLPGLVELSWGRNTNRSGLDRGFTHGCLGRFTDAEAFKRYWEHPAHARFMGVLDELCEDRFAIDYESEPGD